MAVDIMKFLVLYILVLFAFGCGLNQLLWYYADLEWHKCYDKKAAQFGIEPGPDKKGGVPDYKGEEVHHAIKVP